MPRRSARLTSSMVVRTSPAAHPESPPARAAIRNRKKNSSCTNTEKKDEEPIRPQKRRKQSTSNTPSLHPSLRLKNVRGRRGALKDIVEMPLDILHEIFMYLTPGEVLSLSRMCKALRRILMTKSAEFVWKQARLNLDDELPDCPDDLNEAQYANLIFTPLCDGCEKAKGQYYMWSNRRSYCGACNKGLLRRFKFRDGTDLDILLGVSAIHPRSKTETFQVSDNHLIYESYAKHLLGNFQKFRKSDDREAWIQQVEDTRSRRIDHGGLCENWLRMQVKKRSVELDKIRQRRYAAITRKLIDLGWGKELEMIKGMSSWPSVNQPKDLTDRVWQNMKDNIIKKMEEHRAYRLEQEYLAAQEQRRALLESCLDDLRENSIGVEAILPKIFDLESTEAISTLIKAPTGETIEFPESLILESVQNWRASCDAVLLKMVVTRTTPMNGVNPLSLATTFFSCWRHYSPYVRHYRCYVLQYPEVLTHECATSMSDYESCPCPWNVDGKRVIFADKAYSLAKGLLEEFGFNPESTMTEDVLWPALIIECHKCSILALNECRALMSWPIAIQHAIEHDHQDERPRMSRTNLTDAELQRVQKAAPQYFGERFKCTKDRYVGNLYSMQDHAVSHLVQRTIDERDCVFFSPIPVQPDRVICVKF